MKFILWFGMSQTGKSSSIKLLTNDQTIKCGSFGQGGSTTSDIKVYTEKRHLLSQSYYHIDTIGLGDNTLKYNDKEILNRIEKEIIKITQQNNINQISAIIVTESFMSDLINLQPIFQQIKNILGNFPKDSIIILGTKKNAINGAYSKIKR